MTVLVRDRASGRIFEERVFGGEALEFLYHGRGKPLVRLLLRRSLPNRIYGWLQRSPRSRARIADFVESLGIDADEAERPLDAYRSLDEFFTRKLRPGVRPIDPSPDHLVSPADGRLLAFAEVGPELVVKSSRVSLAVLVGDRALSSRYVGGAALVLRLAPADYHRFHFPDDGIASAPRRLPGPLDSVHPIALAAGAPSFRNKRVVTVLDSAAFGPLLLIEVGALLVGTIVQTYRPGPVRRGDEKGYFRFGGSTVVVLAMPGRLTIDSDLLEATAAGLETLVRMGTRLAIRR